MSDSNGSLIRMIVGPVPVHVPVHVPVQVPNDPILPCIKGMDGATLRK